MVRVRSFSGGVGKFALRRFCMSRRLHPWRGVGLALPPGVPLRKQNREDTRMYCTKCGKEIADGSTFCSECGAAQAEDNNFHEYPENDNWYGTNARAPYNTMCIIGAVVSGISLFLPFCGIAGFILSRMGKKQVEETGERGRELALAGMIVGGITAGITAVGLVILLATLAWGALASLGLLFS